MLSEVPSQELAVFGRAILEDANKIRLPRLPFLQQTRVFPEKIIAPDETNLHNREVFCLTQVFYNVVNSGLLWSSMT